MSTDVEYDVSFKYTIENSYQAEVLIPRKEIPLVCEAFEIVMQDRFGASFYYPRSPNGKTTCRYEWFLKYKNDPYGIRLTAIIYVGNTNITQCEFFVSWGPRFSINKGKGFPKYLENRIVQEIGSVREEVEKILRQQPNELWTFFSYIKFPPGTFIKESIISEILTFYPTVYDNSNKNYISAVGIHVPAFYKEQAKSNAQPILDRFIALLSLLSGKTFSQIIKPLPKQLKSSNVILGSNITMQQLYQKNWKTIDSYTNLSDVAEIAINLLSNNLLINDETLWESIYAYVSGQEITRKQPTLSSVAFVASLAAYSKVEKCKGSISCSKCGEISLKHNLISEKESIINEILKVIFPKLDDNETKELRSLIRDVHSKQRSAFVHDAKLRHAEIDKNINLGRPDKTRIVSTELQYSEDLHSIQELSRRVLLSRLISFDEKIAPLIQAVQPSRIRKNAIVYASHTLRARRPIGVRYSEKI